MATKQVLAEIKQDLESFVGTRIKLKSFKEETRSLSEKAF